jgi:hypothetical protein
VKLVLLAEAEAELADAAAWYDDRRDGPGGRMLVVARDASEEAARLRGQGTKVVPTKLTPELAFVALPNPWGRA